MRVAQAVQVERRAAVAVAVAGERRAAVAVARVAMALSESGRFNEMSKTNRSYSNQLRNSSPTEAVAANSSSPCG